MSAYRGRILRMSLSMKGQRCRSSSDPARSPAWENGDRKSTRLNSSHMSISYAVFCLKKKRFIFVTPEYNHGVPGAFKNAFDSLGHEWVGKPVAFVSHGSVCGVRSVEQW